MLVAALGQWPYGYYTLLRVVVCIAALLLALAIFRRADEITLWCAAFIAVGIVFNPLLPLHLTRAIWGFVDFAIAILFVVHFFITRRIERSARTP